MLMVTANSRNMRPTTPPMNRTGMNTATSDSVIDRMVKPISLLPRNAAANGVSPASTWRTMFSSMTMASSTTKPTESVSAISEMLFKLKPHNCMAAKVPNIDNRQRQRRDQRRRTLAQEQEDHQHDQHRGQRQRRAARRATDARIDCDRSIRTSILTDGGIAARSTGNIALMLSTTATVLAPGWR